MGVEKTKNGSVITIIILVILVIALSGYIGYDKFLIKDKTTENTKQNEESKESTEKSDYVKTRTCTGFYKGTAALTQDFQTGDYEKGTLTIELKADSTYELKKENINGASGEYTIIDNILLLKTEPEICGPNMECDANYTQFLSISEDCSNISQGYGSYFFDPIFTLNKQN